MKPIRLTVSHALVRFIAVRLIARQRLIVRFGRLNA